MLQLKPWKHYAKSEQPVSEDHTAYGSIYVKCPEKANPQENRLVDTKGRGEGPGGIGEWPPTTTGFFCGVMKTF
jgi:hypothetical protein